VARVAAHGPPSSPDWHRHSDERRPTGWLPRIAERALSHHRGSAAGRRLRDLSQRQVAPGLGDVDAHRCLAEPSRLRAVLRHAVGVRQLLPSHELTRGEQNIENEAAKPGFFYTDAITTEAESFIRAQSTGEPGQPFLLYVAFTAPHWPLHAPAEDIARYRG